MESVAQLKQENRKLLKQVKDAEARAGAEGSAGGAVSNNKVSQREMARLSVEHEHLTAEVAQMK